MEPVPCVHVYYAHAGDWENDALDGARALLDAAERERASRFRFDRDRRTYVVAHALLRRSLARHAPVSPAGFRFVSGPHGRPELDLAGAAAPLRFSLSHTGELAACAVTRALDVGLDVEDTSREAPLDVASRFFTAAEAGALSSLAPSARPALFFSLWTLKEAYVKARGLGLSLPLDGFAFDLGPEGVRAAFSEACPDDPKDWCFRSFSVGDRYRAGLAARSAREVTVILARDDGAIEPSM